MSATFVIITFYMQNVHRWLVRSYDCNYTSFQKKSFQISW